MSEQMQVVEGRRYVRSAVTKWRRAFKELGRTDHGYEKTLIWIDELGIWLNAKGRRNNAHGYWNGLGIRLGGGQARNLIVEVNPPENGTPQGRFQGVVAEAANGSIWLLHRGELNVAGVPVKLKDHGDVVSAAPGLTSSTSNTPTAKCRNAIA